MLGVLALLAVVGAAVVVLTRDGGGTALPEGCQEGEFVCITDPPQVSEGRLVAEFSTGADLVDGVESVWFFNDVAVDEIGADSPALFGRWTGGSPFDGFSEDTARRAAGRGADELCVALADVVGTQIAPRADTGNCQPLPASLTGS